MHFLCCRLERGGKCMHNARLIRDASHARGRARTRTGSFQTRKKVMPRKFLKRYLPTAADIRANRSLEFLGARLHDPNLWHLNRRSVSVAAAVGGFCAFIPLPVQMPCAAMASLMLRSNVPLAVALVWISNPITIPPMFFFAYQVGAWLLSWPDNAVSFEFSFAWFADQVGHIWQPLLLGSALCSLALGGLLYVIVRVLWRMRVVHRWRKRRESRLTRGVTQRPG